MGNIITLADMAREYDVKVNGKSITDVLNNEAQKSQKEKKTATAKKETSTTKATKNKQKTKEGRSRDASSAPTSSNERSTDYYVNHPIDVTGNDWLTGNVTANQKAVAGRSGETKNKASTHPRSGLAEKNYNTVAAQVARENQAIRDYENKKLPLYKENMRQRRGVEENEHEYYVEKGKNAVDKSAPRSASRAKSNGFTEADYYNVGKYGFDRAYDTRNERERAAREAEKKANDKNYIAEQQHIHRISNRQNDEYYKYRAEQFEKTAKDEDKSRMMIDLYHLRDDNTKNRYYRLLNDEGLDSATQFAMKEAGYDDFKRYADDAYKSRFWEDEKWQEEQNLKAMDFRDRRYLENQQKSLDNYAALVAADPNAIYKIKEGENKKGNVVTHETDPLTSARRFMGGAYENINWSLATEDEKRIYNYLYATDEAAAQDYLSKLENVMHSRTNKIATKNAADFAEKHPIAATGLSVAGSLGSGFEALGNTATQIVKEKLGGEYLPPQELANRNVATDTINTLSGTVGGGIDNKALRFLYEAGVSTANNVVGMAVYNGLYPLMMSVNAAGNETQSGLKRGADKGMAMLNGAANGTVEYLTEKMGFDRIMDIISNPVSKASKNYFGDLAIALTKNAGSEFGEETVGAVLQNTIDMILMGDNSSFKQIVEQHMAKGASEDDAARAAFFELYVSDPLKNGLAGALSGAVIGGVGATYNVSNAGKYVLNQNISDAALSVALKAPSNSATKAAAETIKAKLESGSTATNHDFGRLYYAMAQDEIHLPENAFDGEMNNVYYKKGGGVAGTTSASRLSKAEYSILDKLGKATGRNIVVKDLINVGDNADAANGVVSAKDPNTIFISANSTRPFYAVAKHEFIHTIGETEAGKEYIKGITKSLKAANPEGYEMAVEQIKAKHEAYGDRISGAKADEEVAADAAWKMLGSYSAVAKLTDENPSLAKKIYNKLTDLLGAVQGIYADDDNVAAAALDSLTAQELSRNQQLFASALNVAPKVSETSYALKEPPLNISDMTDEEIEEIDLRNRREARGWHTGKFGLSDREVRLSRLSAPEDDDIDYLSRENKTMSIMLSRLSRNVRKVAKGKITVDSKAVINVVKDSLKREKSRTTYKTVAPFVARAYSALLDLSTTINPSEEYSQELTDSADVNLRKAAKLIVDGTGKYDNTIFNESQAMKEYIKDIEIRIPDNFEAAPMDDQRRENIKLLNLKKDTGITVEELYSELSKRFPHLFKGGLSNENNLLFIIAYKLANVKATPDFTTEDYENEIKAVAADLSLEFTDVLFDPETQTNIIVEIEKETHEKFRKFYDKISKEAQDKYAEKRRRLDAKYRKKWEETKEREAERKERAETIERLQKILNRVRKLKTTDESARKHLNAALAEVAYLYSGAKGRPQVMSEEVLKQIFGDDYKSVLEQMSPDEILEYEMDEYDGRKHFISIDAIRRYYNDTAAKNPNHIKNEYLERKFEAADLNGINELGAEDAKEIIKMLTAIETDVQNANKLINSKVKATVHEISKEATKQLKKVKGTKGSGAFSKFISGHLTPGSAMRKFMGYQKDNKLVSLVQEISDGERNKDAIIQKAMHIFDGFMAKKENKRFLDSLDDVVEIAKGVKITKGMRLSLAMYARNKASAEHIHGGGITIPDLNLLEKGKKEAAYKKGKTVQITQEMQKKITESLSAQEKELIQNIDKAMEFIASEINETTMELYGVEIANVKNYFPILTDKAFLGKDVNSFDNVGDVENAGFMKARRPGSYTPIVLNDCVAVTMAHINNAAKVAGLSIPMRNFKAVYSSASYNPTFDFVGGVKDTSYASLRKALEATWGSEAVNYIDAFIKDIEVGRRSDNEYSGFLDRRFAALATSALLTNLSVVIKQAAAYPTAGAVLGFKSLIKGLGSHVSKADKALYDSITPVVWKRTQGYGMASFADYSGGPSIEQKLPALFGWIQKSDVATAYKICKACEKYVADNYKLEKGSEEWKAKLAETINQAIERTQQGSNVSQRAAILRSPNSLVHALNTFKTQVYLQVDLIIDAVGEYNAYKHGVKDGTVKKEDLNKSAKKLANVITAQIVAEVVMTCARLITKSLIFGKKEWEDEDGKFSLEKLLKVFGETAFTDIAGMLMYGNEISDLLASIFTDERYYGIDISPVALITDAAEAFVRVVNSGKNINDLKNEGQYYTYKDMLTPAADFITKFAAVCGVPARNMKNLVGALYNNVFKILDNTPLAKQGESMKKAVDSLFTEPQSAFADNKKEASDRYKLAPNFDNSKDYKKYAKSAGIIKEFETLIAENPKDREKYEKLLEEYSNIIDSYNLPDDVSEEAKRLYDSLIKSGYSDVAEKAIPYSTASMGLKFNYGGENFDYTIKPEDCKDYVKGLFDVNAEAYRELINDSIYKEQDAITQLKMLDKLRTEKTRLYEADIFDKNVGFSAEQKAKEDRKLYNAALDFKGLPGKNYVKIEDYQFEVSDETFDKYNTYIDNFDKAVKKALDSGQPLNSIPGFEKAYFMDSNNKRVYITEPYSKYNKAFQKKIDTKIQNVAKESFTNPTNDAQKNLVKEIVKGEGIVYIKNEETVKKINNGDYSQNAWTRKNLSAVSGDVKKQAEEKKKLEEIERKNSIVEVGKKYIGVKYVYGGTSPNGFDCSGLMQYIYKEKGININRTAATQFKQGAAVDKSGLQPGDLVFFRGGTGTNTNPGHVGMYVGDGKFLHAPQTGDVVKISNLDARKDYVGARRIVG